MRDAYRNLEQATHWRQRNFARDALIALGRKVLPTVLEGTAHASEDVRGVCQEILRGHFATDERAIDAIVRGLRDASAPIVYASAFHLGEHGVLRAAPALRELAADPDANERARHAAWKSLGELAAKDAIVPLWSGLGSDDAYARYLANLGIKGLCGKDLTDFEYEGPWEGAFVSGPAVAQVKGQPIEKAEKRARRWQAIAAFGRWLKAERADLFAELEDKLW